MLLFFENQRDHNSFWNFLNFEEFLAKMSELTSIPLSEYSNVWKFLPQEVQDLEVDGKKGTISQGCAILTLPTS